MSFDNDTSPDRGDSALAGFGSPAPAPSNVSGMMGATREMSEVQSAMVIADARPRDPRAAIERILTECGRPGLAEGALYEFKRGKALVTGPSIRLAETLAREWGHLQFGMRELEQRHGASTVEAFAWDVQKNVRQSKTFQVPHVRYTKQGAYDLEDPRDIYEMAANMGARRMRACILGLIPGDVVEAAVKACEETQRAHIDVTPELIEKLVDAFAEFDVTKAQIEQRIQRRLDAMTPGLVVQLRKIHTSLKDGMSAPSDWFEPEEGEASDEPKSMDELKATLAKSRAKREAKSDGAPTEAAPVDDDTEPDQARVEWTATVEELLHDLSPAERDIVAERHFPNGLEALSVDELKALATTLGAAG